jgi:hypothetical protein
VTGVAEIRDLPLAPPPAVLAPGEAYRRLLLPEGGRWVQARRWRLAELGAAGGDDDHLLWGERRVGRAAGLAAVARRVVAREAAITALRLGVGRGGRDLQVRRLATDGAGGGFRRRLAGQLRRGTVVELIEGAGVERPFEQVLRAAAVDAVGPMTVGAGGGLLLRVRREDGRPGILRIGLDDDPSDPAPAADALQRLVARPEVPAPTLLDRGRLGSVTWSLESLLRGRTCTVLTPEVWSAVVAAWQVLPRLDGEPSATAADLEQLVVHLPQHAEVLISLRAAIGDALTTTSGVLAHRDLWPGNLLVHRGMLAGVVDWGAWRPDALPGVDLLQLFASAERRRRGEHLGRAWLRRPWTEAAFRSATEPYWEAVGLEPDDRYLAAVGIGWWAGEVAGTLERLPDRQRDARWLAANVHPVLDALKGR